MKWQASKNAISKIVVIAITPKKKVVLSLARRLAKI